MQFLKSLVVRFGIAGELIQLLWEERLWWMIPLAVLLLGLSVVIMLAHSSVIGPFIYTLF
jgi:Family of unknown function (DUF5989)